MTPWVPEKALLKSDTASIHEQVCGPNHFKWDFPHSQKKVGPGNTNWASSLTQGIYFPNVGHDALGTVLDNYPLSLNKTISLQKVMAVFTHPLLYMLGDEPIMARTSGSCLEGLSYVLFMCLYCFLLLTFLVVKMVL